LVYGIPPFCVLAYESITAKPWVEHGPVNVWGEPKDKPFTYRGHSGGAKFLANGMLEAGFDVSYAYRPLHHQLGHAFLDTLLFLDYDRHGFPYPVVPFQVNCYGRRVISQQAGVRGLTKVPRKNNVRYSCGLNGVVPVRQRGSALYRKTCHLVEEAGGDDDGPKGRQDGGATRHAAARTSLSRWCALAAYLLPLYGC
jgi:hypothetical protein